MDIHEIIQKLNLQPHPEGGYFAETYRSAGTIDESALPMVYSGARNYATTIYFLLMPGQFSAFHRIHQDEGWHFYMGQPVRVHMITPEGEYSYFDLGVDLNFQFTVPGGIWFASEVLSDSSYGLVGCTVSPGFDFRDFEMATREELVKDFPSHEAVIRRMTRE